MKKKPGESIIEVVAPFHAIDGLPLADNDMIKNVAHAETRDSLRIPRGGGGSLHEASLVAVKRYYDGANGGVAEHYLNCWVEFRALGSRWRTSGVKIRGAEAARITRAMLAGKPSKPGRNEEDRVGGRENTSTDSELRGVPLPSGAYLIFVRHKNRAGEWARTRGVEILDAEKAAVAAVLKQVPKE